MSPTIQEGPEYRAALARAVDLICTRVLFDESEDFVAVAQGVLNELDGRPEAVTALVVAVLDLATMNGKRATIDLSAYGLYVTSQGGDPVEAAQFVAAIDPNVFDAQAVADATADSIRRMAGLISLTLGWET